MGISWRKGILFLFILVLPWQLNTYLFANSSYISGVRVDYLAYVLSLTDLIWPLLLITFWRDRIAPFIAIHAGLLITGTVFVSLQLAIFNYPVWTTYTFLRGLQILSLIPVFRYLEKEEQKLVPWAFFLTSIIQAALVVQQFFYKGSLQGVWYFLGERANALSTPGIAKLTFQGVELLRPYGTFSHPNAMAGFFLLVLLITLSTKRLVWQPITAATMVACVVIITLSGSQLALGALLVALLVKSRSFLVRVCSLGIGGILTFITIATRDDPMSISGRIEGMRAAMSVIAANPLWGVGLGNHLRAMSEHPTNRLFMLIQPVHSALLYLVTEIGLGGLFISIVSFRRYLAPTFSLVRKNFPILIALTITMMGDHYWITSYQNRLLLGLMLGILLRREDKKPKQTLAIGGLAGQSKDLTLQDA